MPGITSQKMAISSIHSDFYPMASSRIFQIPLRVAVQNQIGLAQRVVVDEVIQFRLLRHGHIQRILNPGAVDGSKGFILFSQKHKNPNPSPIEKRFGFSLFGAIRKLKTCSGSFGSRAGTLSKYVIFNCWDGLPQKSSRVNKIF